MRLEKRREIILIKENQAKFFAKKENKERDFSDHN